MRRSAALVLVAAMFASSAALAPRESLAGTPLAGTASCGVRGVIPFSPYLPLLQTPSDRTIRFRGKLTSVSCDGTDVSGGKAPLASAIVKLKGRMPMGTNCESLLSSVAIEKGVVEVKWRGLHSGGPQTVSLGTSRAAIASASFDADSGSFVITTAPIAKGAFAGKTVTLALPLGDIPEYIRICNLPQPNNGVGFASFNYGPPMNQHVVPLTVE